MHDNVPAHTSAIAMTKIHELGFELLPYPASPNLASCDFHLFPSLKKWLGEKKFSDNSKIIDAGNDYFEKLDKSFYKNGIMAFEYHWTKCAELKADYIEKIQFNLNNYCFPFLVP